MKWWEKWTCVPVIWFYLNVFCTHAKSDKSSNVMSVVVDQNDPSQQQDYVQFIDLPSGAIYHNSHITLEYHCSAPSRVGADISVWTVMQQDVLVFQRIWDCDPKDGPRRKTIEVHLPRNIAYKPSFLNHHSLPLERSVLQGWVLDGELWKYSTMKMAYRVAVAKVSHDVQVAPPYERESRVFSMCMSWWLVLQARLADPYSPVCQVEQELFRGVTFPLALSGSKHGVHRVPPVYKNKILERNRGLEEHLSRPKFTFVVWLYIVEYCKIGSLCSIVQHLTWDDLYMTPLIFITRKGKLHIQVVRRDGQSVAFISYFTMPKDQWCRMVASLDNNHWSVTINYGENWKEEKATTYTVDTGSPVWFDDTQGILVFGGSEMSASFKGYIGKAELYRNKVVTADKLHYPSPYHPMFMLGLGDREKKCSNLLSWVSYRVTQCQQILQAIIDRKSCSNTWQHVLTVNHPTGRLRPETDQCPLYGGPRSRQYSVVDYVVRRWVMDQRKFELEELAGILYVKAKDLLEDQGFQSISSIVPMLKQASCYGNHDASFMLAAILNNGIGVKSDEIQAQSYLMYGALDQNRLCLMALGNKHMYGLDGVPYDAEQAYVYYKNVADTTRQDRESHKSTDSMTEMVRLTDDAAIDRQTDEDGDLYNWFKHQASQGVVSAQKEMGRLLFWGAQGIKRNLAAAVDYYRQGAESNDPTAMYDYGLVLMKGQGTKKNMTEAMNQLGKAADGGSPQAMNALGWHALELEKNYTKAAELFSKSYRRGNPDAAHNLGHMYLSGIYPGHPSDKLKAFSYFSFAAQRGQIDSGVMVALYNMRGHPSLLRNPKLAAEWARFITEQNPAVGNVLAKALKAYRQGNWALAILFYALAASTGVEVANFNLAYLCDENKEGLATNFEKECVWSYFNMSTLREPKLVNTYSWIKMGDFHWYGWKGTKDSQKAAKMYANAAARGDPQAIFNLAFLVEQGVEVRKGVWDHLRVPRAAQENNVTLLVELYSRCKASRNSEAYLPCTLALFRLQLFQVWQQHNVLVRISSALGVMVALAVTLTSMYSFVRRHPLNVNTV